MFRERTLLERLAKPRSAFRHTLSENTHEATRSILRHLQKMLNSRQGHAPAQLDYGIPDPSEVAHSFPDAINQMQRAIRICIEKYEPRLTQVSIAHIETELDVLSLRYQITGQITASTERTAITFDTVVDASGRIQVRS
ncbi:MAG: type VI secretion system baseplate subunit TssE [Planctomycetota bacterium]